MTVAVVTVAYGEKYRAHLKEWAQAVAALVRQPNEVIIATDDTADALLQTLDLECAVKIFQPVPAHRRHPQIYANRAIEYANTEWICRLDVDDRIYPHALNLIDTCETDVLCFGISVNGERNLQPPPVTAAEILACPHNLLFAGSPFRKAAWEKTPGYQDMLYDDWRFWRDLASIEATFTPTGTIDYEYRWSPDSSTYGIDHEKERERVFAPLH